MKKADFVAAIAENSGLSKKDAEAALNGMFDTLKKLDTGDKVTLVGTGSFEKKHKPATTARNPATGAQIDVAAKDVIQFRMAKDFLAA